MTAAPEPRPAIVVRPMDRAAEIAYISATSVDAIVETHGGRFARREIFRGILGDLIAASDVQVALFDDDPVTILGFALWSPDRLLELLYLRGSLSRTACPPDCPGCARSTFHNHLGRRVHRELAVDVVAALLGPTKLVTMRRKPSQEWAWSAVRAGGYIPSITPGGI